ncbi:hypothetical protein HMPREF1546_01586 [Oscillibacter sp. KLE 1745]|nr:hypothetical protein HMPREF1546_01586 [Oscillibacter sp. KLE 1745]
MFSSSAKTTRSIRSTSHADSDKERENEPVFPFPVIIRYFSVFAKNFWRISGSICRF